MQKYWKAPFKKKNKTSQRDSVSSYCISSDYSCMFGFLWFHRAKPLILACVTFEPKCQTNPCDNGAHPDLDMYLLLLLWHSEHLFRPLRHQFLTVWESILQALSTFVHLWSHHKLQMRAWGKILKKRQSCLGLKGWWDAGMSVKCKRFVANAFTQSLQKFCT